MYLCSYNSITTQSADVSVPADLKVKVLAMQENDSGSDHSVVMVVGVFLTTEYTYDRCCEAFILICLINTTVYTLRKDF